MGAFEEADRSISCCQYWCNVEQDMFFQMTDKFTLKCSNISFCLWTVLGWFILRFFKYFSNLEVVAVVVWYEIIPAIQATGVVWTQFCKVIAWFEIFANSTSTMEHYCSKSKSTVIIMTFLKAGGIITEPNWLNMSSVSDVPLVDNSNSSYIYLRMLFLKSTTNPHVCIISTWYSSSSLVFQS